MTTKTPLGRVLRNLRQIDLERPGAAVRDGELLSRFLTHQDEIAFEGIAASNRHKSGVALRFPRISRWRYVPRRSSPRDGAGCPGLIGVKSGPRLSCMFLRRLRRHRCQAHRRAQPGGKPWLPP